MDTYYGFPIDQWEKAKEEVRDILISKAKQQDLITYTDLVTQMTTIRLEPDSYALPRLLWEVTSKECASGRGMLTAIVVHKDDNRPGKGFFEAARSLGKNVSDEDLFWAKEVAFVFNTWGINHSK